MFTFLGRLIDGIFPLLILAVAINNIAKKSGKGANASSNARDKVRKAVQKKEPWIDMIQNVAKELNLDEHAEVGQWFGTLKEVRLEQTEKIEQQEVLTVPRQQKLKKELIQKKELRQKQKLEAAKVQNDEVMTSNEMPKQDEALPIEMLLTMGNQVESSNLLKPKQKKRRTAAQRAMIHHEIFGKPKSMRM